MEVEDEAAGKEKADSLSRESRDDTTPPVFTFYLHQNHRTFKSIPVTPPCSLSLSLS